MMYTLFSLSLLLFLSSEATPLAVFLCFSLGLCMPTQVVDCVILLVGHSAPILLHGAVEDSCVGLSFPATGLIDVGTLCHFLRGMLNFPIFGKVFARIFSFSLYLQSLANRYSI
ncbi:hypothetical protein BJ165DRAFT_199202 [Panaeolus papilionaceus]|nr:hypothetical protein BJ165DRAFT_199202 [Panaeolus papilionaceus]